MLEFFKVKTTSKVLELDPGAGWYTELLAPVLQKKGKLAVNGADPRGPRTERATFYAQRTFGLLDKAPELGAKVDWLMTPPPGPFVFAKELEGTFDVVLAFRALHNWQRRGQLDANLAEVFRVLAPGGVFGVEAHRAAAGADPKVTAEKGYLPEAYVVERAEAAGFVREASSEMNANPKDTKDYADGVWALPPALRGGDKDKQRFLDIGESDRMTIRFVKPKKGAKLVKPKR
jgi:predicted methyltransferase